MSLQNQYSKPRNSSCQPTENPIDIPLRRISHVIYYHICPARFFAAFLLAFVSMALYTVL